MKKLIGDGRYGLLLDDEYNITHIIDCIAQEEIPITKQELLYYSDYIEILNTYIKNETILDELLEFDYNCENIRYTSLKDVYIDTIKGINDGDCFISTTTKPQRYDILCDVPLFYLKNKNAIEVHLVGSIGYGEIGTDKADTFLRAEDISYSTELIVRGFPNCTALFDNIRLTYLSLYGKVTDTTLKDSTLELVTISSTTADININNCHISESIGVDDDCRNVNLHIYGSNIDSSLCITEAISKANIVINNTNIARLEIGSIKNVNVNIEGSTIIHTTSITVMSLEDLDSEWDIDISEGSRIYIDIKNLEVNKKLLDSKGFKRLLNSCRNAYLIISVYTDGDMYDKLEQLLNNYNIKIDVECV